MSDVVDPGIGLNVSSITQRALIPRRVPSALNIVTVPEEELDVPSDLRTLAPQIFGVPLTLTLDLDAYEKTADVIRGTEVWEAINEDYYELYVSRQSDRRYEQEPDDFDRHVIEPHRIGYSAFARMMDFSREADDIAESFAEHVTVCHLENWADPNIMQTTLYPNSPPLSFLLRNGQASNLHRLLSENGLEPDAFLLALRVQSLGLNPSPRVREALEDIYEYDIPFGQSPDMSSDTFLSLLRSARKVVLIPLLAGALTAYGHIDSGEYVMALQASSTGAASSLVLAGSLRVTGYLTNELARKRDDREEKDREENDE